MTCGNSRYDTTGWISYFQQIPDAEVGTHTCLWTIIAEENHFVLLKILSLQIEWSSGCEESHLKVSYI